MLRIVAIFLFFILLSHQVVANNCPDAKFMRILLAKEMLYFGEVHGTKEGPEVFLCVVDYAIETYRPKIVSVILELPEEARDLNSLYWSGTDGRASEAEWELVKVLSSYKQGAVKLNFQIETILKPLSTKEYEEYLASRITQFSGAVTLIYGGNYHSSNRPGSYQPDIRPAGMIVGDRTAHLAIARVSAGTAWVCLGADDCGVKVIPKSELPYAKAGTLAPALDLGYDYLYFVERYSASPPHIKSSQPLP
jgi:hypothetical protein